jgi:hypothetical protein
VQVAAQALVQQRGARRVAVADQLDRSLRELDRARRRTRVPGQLGRPGAQPGEVDVHERGGVGHCVPQPERALEVRQRLRHAEDGLRLARRRDRGGQRLLGAAGRRPVRRQLRRHRGAAARELLSQPPVQLLALAGQQRRVDRLGQQRVAETEAARCLHRHQHAMLHRLPQRLAHLGLGQRRHRAEQWVAHVAAGGRGQPQHALGRRVEPRGALQQHLAQATRQRAALVAGGGQQLLGEERVALGAGDDLVRQRRRRQGVGASRQQRGQLLTLERAELDRQRRARAPHAIRQPAHALGRGEFVRAVGRQQQDPPVAQVVGEEDDQVQRGGIGPVQVLEHQQHRRSGRPLAQQLKRLLEHPQLRARRLPIGLRKRSERAQDLDERLVRQLRADEVDRAPEEDLESCVAGARRQLGRKPGLADARLPGDEDGRAAPCLRRAEGALELPELACASDEYLARGSLHSGSIAPPTLARKALVRIPRREDT